MDLPAQEYHEGRISITFGALALLLYLLEWMISSPAGNLSYAVLCAVVVGLVEFHRQRHFYVSLVDKGATGPEKAPWPSVQRKPRREKGGGHEKKAPAAAEESKTKREGAGAGAEAGKTGSGNFLQGLCMVGRFCLYCAVFIHAYTSVRAKHEKSLRLFWGCTDEQFSDNRFGRCDRYCSSGCQN